MAVNFPTVVLPRHSALHKIQTYKGNYGELLMLHSVRILLRFTSEITKGIQTWRDWREIRKRTILEASLSKCWQWRHNRGWDGMGETEIPEEMPQSWIRHICCHHCKLPSSSERTPGQNGWFWVCPYLNLLNLYSPAWSRGQMNYK